VAFADNRSGTATTTNTNVFLARSTDGGVTWTTIPVDTTVNDQFYPWVAVAPNGVVNVGYMDRSHGHPDPANQSVCKYGFTLTRLTALGGLISTQRVDTGLSHADQSRWFSRPTDPRTRFIGDYNAVAVGSNFITWSLWTDMRRTIPGLSPTLIGQQRTRGQHAVGVRTP
jgi:hypothetical protein